MKLADWTVLPRDNSRSWSKSTGCVCAPLTFLHSELACVCTPYRCGCVSVCVTASQFLPYYWLSAAFRLRFQLFSCSLKPVKKKNHSRRVGRRDQKLCILIWGHSVTTEENVCKLQARNWSQNTFQITFGLRHSPDRLLSEEGFQLCTQSYAIKCSGRLPNTPYLRPLFPLPNAFTLNSS